MQLDHLDYRKLVLRTYQLLCSTPELSPSLKQPTPASIRKQCVNRYKGRYERKDEPALTAFFGPAENNSFLTPINNFPTDGFRAFCNYLKGKAETTDHRNVELLAWLIDFPHRPYRLGMDVILSETEKALLKGNENADGHLLEEIENEEEDRELVPEQPFGNNGVDQQTIPVDFTTTNEELTAGKKGPSVTKKWLVGGIALIFTIVSASVYFLYDQGGSCMYWAGDHYERVDCDAEVNDKVAFDKERWKNFRKINDISTITEQSIGIVHYYGNKNREFFTSGGKHPVETTRYLKVMTRYIWEKETGKKDSATKDSSVDATKKPVVN